MLTYCDDISCYITTPVTGAVHFTDRLQLTYNTSLWRVVGGAPGSIRGTTVFRTRGQPRRPGASYVQHADSYRLTFWARGIGGGRVGAHFFLLL